MGNCWCKNSTEESEVYCDNNHVVNDTTIIPNNYNDNSICDVNQPSFKFPTSVDIDKYVLETLSVIGALVDFHYIYFIIFILSKRFSVKIIRDVSNKLSQKTDRLQTTPTQQRNICVLGCIAEKLAGPSSITVLSNATLDYLINNLKKDIEPYIVLYSLIALEKFAQTSENKLTIQKRLLAEINNPLLLLEKWVDEKNYVKRQVGFSAQWCLDNLCNVYI